MRSLFIVLTCALLTYAACDAADPLTDCGQRDLLTHEAGTPCTLDMPAGRPCAPLTLFVDGIPQGEASYSVVCGAGSIVASGALCATLTEGDHVVEVAYGCTKRADGSDR